MHVCQGRLEEDSYTLFREWKESAIRVAKGSRSKFSILKRNGAVMVGLCESGWWFHLRRLKRREMFWKVRFEKRFERPNFFDCCLDAALFSTLFPLLEWWRIVIYVRGGNYSVNSSFLFSKKERKREINGQHWRREKKNRASGVRDRLLLRFSPLIRCNRVSSSLDTVQFNSLITC